MRDTLEITEKELETLRNIIVVQRNEMILSSFEVFQSNRDEEDFYDTIRRILSKIRGKSERPSEKDFSKPSYFVSQRPGTAVEERKTPKQEEPRPKTSQTTNQDNRPKVPELKPKNEQPQKQQETVIKREELPKKSVEEVPKKPQIQPPQAQQKKPEVKPIEPPKKQEVPSKNEERKGEENRENRPQNTPNPKKNMLDLIFKTFFEETEEEFEPIEIGFAKYLYESGDGDVINVLNTCETIPKAVILIKELAVKAYTKWLEDNFEEKQREYVLKNRNERSSEICSIIHVFSYNFRYFTLFS